MKHLTFKDMLDFEQKYGIHFLYKNDKPTMMITRYVCRKNIAGTIFNSEKTFTLKKIAETVNFYNATKAMGFDNWRLPTKIECQIYENEFKDFALNIEKMSADEMIVPMAIQSDGFTFGCGIGRPSELSRRKRIRYNLFLVCPIEED